MSPTAHTLPTLTDGDVLLRAPRDDDAPSLLGLLQHPEVTVWWGETSRDDVAALLRHAFVIEQSGDTVGVVQFDEETEPTYPSVAFDIAIDADLHGRGIGRRALRLAVDYFETRGHHRFTIDPAVTNQMAIRCYQGVGFRPVGILRSCEARGRWLLARRAPHGSPELGARPSDLARAGATAVAVAAHRPHPNPAPAQEGTRPLLWCSRPRRCDGRGPLRFT